MSEMFEKYLDQNNIHNFEGERGVQNLETVVEVLGYERTGFRFGQPIEVFLQDNPGAIQAIIDWIGEQHIAEWDEKLMDYVLCEEDDEEDEE